MNLSLYPATTIIGVVFILMVIFFKMGHWFFQWRKVRTEEVEQSGIGAVEGSLLGLLALMLAFTFSMSGSHYDRRIVVINEEANAIGTAVLRADLYPDSVRKEFKKDFRQYLETRIQFFESGVDLKKVYASLDESAKLQDRLWERAAYYGRKPEFLVQTNMMVPALNEMIDIVSTRNTAILNKVPDIIFYILFALCITASFSLGYAIGHKVDWPIKLGFGIMIAMTLYLAMDLDRERRGIINVGFVAKQMNDLRSMFKADE
ncbi:MAG: hypothetical protein MUE58_06730 [Chitinophagaceae bacterium]|jgi:hypothetical protein|nr:hypothetical protein [Chitinophagaceae bacterium]